MKVILKVNDEEVPLNNYASKVLKKVNWAIVETLKGLNLENIQSINIKIEKKE
jgi:hypothetical protein